MLNTSRHKSPSKASTPTALHRKPAGAESSKQPRQNHSPSKTSFNYATFYKKVVAENNNHSALPHTPTKTSLDQSSATPKKSRPIDITDFRSAALFYLLWQDNAAIFSVWQHRFQAYRISLVAPFERIFTNQGLKSSFIRCAKLAFYNDDQTALTRLIRSDDTLLELLKFDKNEIKSAYQSLLAFCTDAKEQEEQAYKPEYSSIESPDEEIIKTRISEWCKQVRAQHGQLVELLPSENFEEEFAFQCRMK